MRYKLKYATHLHDFDFGIGTVSELKEVVSKIIGLDASNIRLISNGRILEDQRQYGEYEIPEGSTLYAVSIESKPPENLVPAPEEPDNFMKGMMDSPIFQELLANPATIRTLMEMNPKMSELFERNPELRNALCDPESLQRSFAAMNNPSVMREMMRNADRSIQNLEAVPGGMEALQQFHNEVQDPLWSSLDQMCDSNANSSPISLSPQAEPTSAPMENPWASPDNGSHSPSPNSQAHARKTVMPPLTPPAPRFSCQPFIQINIKFWSVADGAYKIILILERVEQTKVTFRELQTLIYSQISGRGIVHSPEQIRLVHFPQKILTTPQKLGKPLVSELNLDDDESEVELVLIQDQTASNAWNPLSNLTSLFQGSGPSPLNFNNPQFLGGAPSDNMLDRLMGVNLPSQGGDPEEIYKEQLNVLENMGFTDKSHNIDLLRRFNGNINTTIDHLLGMG